MGVPEIRAEDLKQRLDKPQKPWYERITTKRSASEHIAMNPKFTVTGPRVVLEMKTSLPDSQSALSPDISQADCRFG
jgi:hypothetical protein